MAKNAKGNLYSNTAFLYDYDPRTLLSFDTDLVLKCVDKTKGDMLEIACGTGRISIPMHLRTPGRKLTAFDLSDTMLDIFRQKALAAGLQSSGNLQIEKANMTNFDFKNKYGLIVLIWRSFQCLFDPGQAHQCLESIKKHMDEETLLLFSVSVPYLSYGKDWVGKESIAYEITDPQTGNHIKRTTKNLWADEKEQIIEYASIYDVTAPDGRRESYRDDIKTKYYHPEQIRTLLKNHQFCIHEEHQTDNDIFLEVGI